MLKHALRGLLLALTLLLAVPPTGRADEARARDVYVRRKITIPQTVKWLVGEARLHRVGQLLVVFDMASFAPPPGVTEFSADRLYTYDLDAWIDALGNEVADAPFPIRATSSLAPKTIKVGEPVWKQDLRDLVTRKWWDGDAVQQIEPAARWMNRLLKVTESGIGPHRGEKRRMLTLISGSITPERWTFLGNRPTWEIDWRLKLLPVGKYWDEEAIATLLDRDGCRFYCIAPENLFGDFRPYVELPQLPWASRPQLPPLRYGQGESSAPVTPPAFDEDEMRKRLDEHYKERFPDPAERRKQVEAMIERMRKSLREPARPPERDLEGRRPRRPSTPGPSPITPGGSPPPLQSTSWRFRSITPYWFAKHDYTLVYNNHAPSGYGYWPFARVAAKSKGKYFFYPFPPTKWLDICPQDPILHDKLLPDLIHKSKYLARLKGDRAHDAIAKAANLVIDETPWTDNWSQGRSASGWSTFKRTAPLRYHPDWFLRRKPWEVVFEDRYGARAALIKTGTRIKEEVLPRYDQAIFILDRALAREASAGTTPSSPRAVADLHLARFWFSMSAFHLDAFATYGLEMERFVPDRLKGNYDRVWVTYIPTIKMSDVLDAYDGRTLSLEDEKLYERYVWPDQPGQQQNILLIDGDDPNYRAQRNMGSVLRHLDPRLRRRALDMIFCARRLMKTYAQSGWGWTTYYSIAYTFIFMPVPQAEGPPGGRPGEVVPPPPPPTTPRGPDVTPGGSSPGGPTTGK